MEAELKDEFERSGFSIEEEDQTLKKCPTAFPLLAVFFFPNHFVLGLRVMDLVFFFAFRSYFLHKLQAEAFGSCLELGDLLAQQVKMRSFWMLFCEIVVLFEVSLVQLICLRFCMTDFKLLFFWR